MQDALGILRRAHPVMPVMVIPELRHALPLAAALASAGIEVFEITLRSDCAMEALAAIAQAYPQLAVGAGTVTTPDELERVRDAGAGFAISPGLTPALAQRARDLEFTLVPGVMTPADAMLARDHGIEVLKLFPASVAGGIPMLKALGGPFPELRFCPTGGIGPDNYRDFLALANVECVGGSWICPEALVREERWDEITALAGAVSA